METSLCLLVKDEENTLTECLSPIRDLFDDVVVMDTGSTDRTCELLQDRFGITPHLGALEERLCYSKCDARNQLLSHARHPWVLVLDADERITREQALTIRNMEESDSASGYFCAWTTYINDAAIEDYKLSLFRRDVRYSGLVHENAQQHLRRSGGSAAWLNEVTIAHYPEARKLPAKRTHYKRRLECALGHDPAWYRYHWFMGYMCFRSGENDEAARYLTAAVQARSLRFPVECLNSHMLLAHLHASRGDARSTAEVLELALSFHQQTKDDFEVRVNFRLKPWLDAARQACRREPWSVSTSTRLPIEQAPPCGASHSPTIVADECA